MATTTVIPQGSMVSTAKIYSSKTGVAAADSPVVSDWFPCDWATNAEFVFDVTAVTTGTLNFYIQRECANGDPQDIISVTQLNSVTKRRIHFFPQAETADSAFQDAALTAGSIKATALGKRIRVKCVVAGANPAAQFDVYCTLFA